MVVQHNDSYKRKRHGISSELPAFRTWNSVKQEYDGRLKIVKIDHDANPQLIEEYKVFGLPTLILFKNGQEVPGSRREGAITKDKFKQYLEPFLATTVA